ncbi:MAG: hypothetical protein CSB55_07305 [Candidatus Cloacimonadota bacterium]|nr:MAG: hypothetical protein CSB55_07305 [Candidatus Cloacimonadota bacterium]
MQYSPDEIIFSVIVAVYNRDKYIEECIQSVLEQEFKNFELIVVDDGSVDKTAAKIKTFQDSRLKYFYKEHSGCWETKNLGLDKASGKFIVFLDSDDYLGNYYLKSAFRLIYTYENFDYYYPEKLFIAEEDGRVTNSIWRYIAYPLNERLKIISLFMNKTIGGIPHTGAFVRKEVYERLGKFNGELHNFGDTDYIIRRADKIKFKHLPELRYYYKRHHKHQICKDYDFRNKTTADLIEYCLLNYPENCYLPQTGKPMTKEEFAVRKLLELAETSPPPSEPFIEKSKKIIKMMREKR